MKFTFSAIEWFNILLKCGVIYWHHRQTIDLKPDSSLVSLIISAQISHCTKNEAFH